MPSTEPSSTTTSSRSRSVCPSTLATAWPIVARASRAARTTETSGGLIASAEGSLRRCPEPRVPSVDLVVATVDRTEPLDALLGSLEAQTHRAARVLVVDQNDDDRVAAVARLAPVAPDRARALRRPGCRAPGTSRSACSRPISSRSPTTTAAIRRISSSRSSRGSRRTPALGVVCGRLEDEDGRATGRFGRERRRVDAGRRVARRELAHDLPAPRGRRAGRGVRRGARARAGRALVVGRGDRLPRPRAPRRRAGRVRPGARRDPSRPADDR